MLTEPNRSTSTVSSSSVVIVPTAKYKINFNESSKKELSSSGGSAVISFRVNDSRGGVVAGQKVIASLPKILADAGLLTLENNSEQTTNAKGEVSFEFDSPESLTRWNLQLLAHNKELASGILKRTVVTQKELMVVPNAPRFMREGDMIVYSAKVSNLTEKELSGSAKLELFDAVTNEPINLFVERKSTTLPFKFGAGQSAPLSWKLKIPFGKTTSYLELSKRLGDPKAIRAVASANGKNPLWIVVPCHRVIGSDGSLTGYAGGIWRKKWLLAHENPVKQQSLF